MGIDNVSQGNHRVRVTVTVTVGVRVGVTVRFNPDRTTP
jgi:hypothetical protein